MNSSRDHQGRSLTHSGYRSGRAEATRLSLYGPTSAWSVIGSSPSGGILLNHSRLPPCAWSRGWFEAPSLELRRASISSSRQAIDSKAKLRSCRIATTSVKVDGDGPHLGRLRARVSRLHSPKALPDLQRCRFQLRVLGSGDFSGRADASCVTTWSAPQVGPPLAQSSDVCIVNHLCLQGC